MKVQNIGGKIVHIGGVVLLPGEVKPVPERYADNAALACLAEHKNVRLVAGETPGESGGGRKSLSRMSKAARAEEGRRLGIEAGEEDAKDSLAEKIRAAAE